MVFRCFENLSFVFLHVEEERPHKPMMSLHANMTGCLVDSRRRNNSAFPPESPDSGGESDPSISLRIRSSLTARNPPPI